MPTVESKHTIGKGKLTERLLAQGILTPNMLQELKREWNKKDKVYSKPKITFDDSRIPSRTGYGSSPDSLRFNRSGKMSQEDYRTHREDFESSYDNIRSTRDDFNSRSSNGPPRKPPRRRKPE